MSIFIPHSMGTACLMFETMLMVVMMVFLLPRLVFVHEDSPSFFYGSEKCQLFKQPPVDCIVNLLTGST